MTAGAAPGDLALPQWQHSERGSRDPAAAERCCRCTWFCTPPDSRAAAHHAIDPHGATLHQRTFTATILVPGATPMTPPASFLAPMMPAQCVPCPSSSSGGCSSLMQLTPATTLRSGWSSCTPVSTTATDTVEAAAEVLLLTAPTRFVPVGTAWPEMRGTAAAWRHVNFPMAALRGGWHLTYQGALMHCTSGLHTAL